MATRLPWFPFYVNDWMDDERVLSLNNEQRGIYLWLLCRQWMNGDLPYDVGDVYPLMPPNTNTAATSFVFLSFFPADPDTNRRANPKLASIRREQEAQIEANKRRTAPARKALRGAVPSVTESVTATKTDTESKTEKDVDAPSGIPALVWDALLPFLGDPKTKTARIGQVRGMLQGITARPIPPEAMARGLTDLHANSGNWSAIAVRAFADKAVKLLEGEAGRRAAESSVSVSPSTPNGPSGWAEEDLE